MGIKRHIQDADEADEKILDIVQKELDKGSIEGLGVVVFIDIFGIRCILSHSKTVTTKISTTTTNLSYYLVIRLFTAVKRLDPEGITRRLNDLPTTPW